VATARDAMGQPYRYGGQGDGGFDCSGLIQYAYAQHGITVPRVSTDQAQVGDEIGRALELLEPGDILTFSSNAGGTRVSHVGLYVGGGRFIHSASSRGVSESRLSADDPNGAWWYARWIGARRIITAS
jgi:cell wall-associated NlpC family hydrolase